MQALDATDGDAVGAEAFDLGPHLHKALAENGHLRLPRGVHKLRLAAGEAGRHQQVLGRADRDLGKHDLGAGETLGREGVDHSEEHTSELPSIMSSSYAVLCMPHNYEKHLIHTR